MTLPHLLFMNFVSYKLLPIHKRILKSLIDFLLFFITGLTLYFQVFNIAFNTQKETELRMDAFIEAGLYVKTPSGGYSMIDSTDYKTYEEVVKIYYTGKNNDSPNGGLSYFQSDFYLANNGKRKVLTIKEFNENILDLKDITENDFFSYHLDSNNSPIYDKFAKLNDDLFTIIDGKKQLKEENKTIIYNFFKDEYLYCFTDLQYDEFYYEAIENQTNKDKLRTFTSFIIPSFTFYLLIPLITKKTLGERLIGAVLIKEDGTKASILRYLIRYIPQLILVSTTLISEMIYVPMIAFGVYLIGDMLVINLSKNYNSIPDLLSKTIVVHEKESKIFNSLSERDEYNKDLLSSLEDVSNKYYEESKNDEL